MGTKTIAGHVLETKYVTGGSGPDSWAYYLHQVDGVTVEDNGSFIYRITDLGYTPREALSGKVNDYPFPGHRTPPCVPPLGLPLEILADLLGEPIIRAACDLVAKHIGFSEFKRLLHEYDEVYSRPLPEDASECEKHPGHDGSY